MGQIRSGFGDNRANRKQLVSHGLLVKRGLTGKIVVVRGWQLEPIQAAADPEEKLIPHSPPDHRNAHPS
jgi:hypothetical protein